MNNSWNFQEKILKKILGKKILIYIITRKIPRGVLATRVCLARTPRNNPKNNFEENFTKKFGKKNWKKNLKKILRKNFDKKIWKKKFSFI